MAATHTIRALTNDDDAAWAERRLEALTAHPLLFGSAPPADPACLRDVFRQRLAPESVVLGAYDEQRLVGIVGVTRDDGAKERHKAFLWGMFVTPAARRHGVGRALLAVAIDHARTWAGVEQLHLTVSEAPGNAKVLYERLGFVAWGRAPRALLWHGASVDETHMVLDLRLDAG